MNNIELYFKKISTLQVDIEVKKTLLHFVGQLEINLKSTLSSVYLIGSLVLDDFHSKTSDIDLMVILNERLNENEYVKVNKVFTSMISYKWINRLEVSFVTERSLKDKHLQLRPYFNGGYFRDEIYGYEWHIDKSILFNKGKNIYGKSIKNLLNTIKLEPLDQIVIKIYEEDILPFIKEWENLSEDYKQFVFSTICRIAYTMETNEITSKSNSIKWVNTINNREYGHFLNTKKNHKTHISLDFKSNGLAVIKEIVKSYISNNK